MTADVGMPVPTSPGACGSSGSSPRASFELDGGSWEVDNNVWLVGDDARCSSSTRPTTPARSSPPSAAAGSSRSCAPTPTTTTSTPSVRLVAATGAPAYLHPDDRVLWDQTQPDCLAATSSDGQVLTVGDVELTVLHTPGHAPGACCLHVPALERGVVGRHPVPRRPGRNGPVVQRLPDDHRVDPHAAPRRCRRRRSCSPGTATRRRSAPRRRTCRSGSPAATETAGGACRVARARGFGVRALRR